MNCVENIIECEELLPLEAIEPVELKLGRRVVFKVTPSDLIQ
jgi:hypothetical protein